MKKIVLVLVVLVLLFGVFGCLNLPQAKPTTMEEVMKEFPPLPEEAKEFIRQVVDYVGPPEVYADFPVIILKWYKDGLCLRLIMVYDPELGWMGFTRQTIASMTKEMKGTS